MMGIGTSSGDTRAVDAAQQAISSPLLESSIDGATRVLLSIAGSKDLGIQEISDCLLYTSASRASSRVVWSPRLGLILCPLRSRASTAPVLGRR